MKVLSGRFEIEAGNGNAFDLVAVRTLFAIMAATLGGLIGVVKGHVSHRVLCGLVSFAAGALLAVTGMHLVPETLHLLGGIPGLGVLVGGTLLFAGIGRYVYAICPACAASATETGYLRLGILLMVAMAIHSTVDGLAISAGCAAEHASGLLIVLAVAYHKVPEGMALVSVARLAGYGRAKALGVTILIQMTTALGAFAGAFLLMEVSDIWLGITLGIVAGSFAYTIGFALLKEMYAHEKNSIIVYAVLGFISIMLLGGLLASLGIHHVH